MSIEGYPSIGLPIIAVGVVLFFLWLPVARHRLHRQREVRQVGPEVMDLRGEAAAIVNLLVNELDLTGDAVAATVLDLAARRHLEIVQLSPERHLIGVRRGPAELLAPFEQRILTAVRTAAGDQPHATVAQLAEALRSSSADTWLQFRVEVQREAQRRGLIATSSSAERSTKTMMLLSLVPCIGVLVTQPMVYILVPFLYVGLLLAAIVLLVIGNSWVLTDAGQAAGTHWLGVRRFIEGASSFDELPAGAVAIWDRYLAYGAAMGLSDRAVHGVVDELRTTITFDDVGRIGVAWGDALRAQRSPGDSRAWRAEQLRTRFGPEASPDDLFGPSSGDFWELVERTGELWFFGLYAYRADARVFAAAARARIDALVAAAPPHLAGDVATLATAARVAVERLEHLSATSIDDLRADERITGPAVVAARDRLIAATAARLQVEPDGRAVSQVLVAGPLRFEDLFT